MLLHVINMNLVQKSASVRLESFSIDVSQFMYCRIAGGCEMSDAGLLEIVRPRYFCLAESAQLSGLRRAVSRHTTRVCVI